MISCPKCGHSFAPTPREPLKPREVEMLDFIGSYIDTHGFSPKYAEIAEHFGYKSLATVAEHVGTLERKGVIKRSMLSSARSIVVLVHADDAKGAAE